MGQNALARLLGLDLCAALLLGAALVLQVSVAGCQRSRSEGQGQSGSQADRVTATPGSGHARMLALLAEIAARTREEHPYLSDLRARQFRDKAAKLPPDTDSFQRWQTHYLTGAVLLDSGHVDEAIAHLTQAYELVPADQFKQPLGNHTRLRLAVAFMRLGEKLNCRQRHGPESCIVPIRSGGVYTRREGPTKAIQYLTEILQDTPPATDLYFIAQWLLNIAYMTLDGYPEQVPAQYRVPERVFRSEIAFPRFPNVLPSLGLPTYDLAGGAIVDDFDNDGLLDIAISTWDPAGQMRYFHNQGDGTFQDRTEAAGLTGLLGGINMVQADYDNDGWLDIYVLRGAWARAAGRHPNSLLRNKGDGTFTDVTFEAGLGEVHYPTHSAAWGDYDNDGDLDLYVGNESSLAIDVDPATGRQLTGEDATGVDAPCQLFCNNGDGTFTDVAAQAGVENHGYTKGVVWGDYDGDRDPDLYVSNLTGPNRLYRNNGDGTFTDVAEQAGVTRPLVSFPVWFWDFDNDGALDLFVAAYTGRIQYVAAHYITGEPPDIEMSCLYRGDGRGGFQDVTAAMGFAVPVLPMGCNFGDVNDDGWLDFYLGTGDPSLESLMPNLMFLNQEGKRFADVTMAGGFGHLQKGHGVAFADLDNDGDTDVYEQMGGAFYGDEFQDALYLNPGFGNHWLGVKLAGVTSNRSAIGARIRVQVRDGARSRSIYRWVTSGGSFGCNPLRQHIGLGKAQAIERLEIFWPTTGKSQVFENVDLDQTIVVTEDEPAYRKLELRPFTLPAVSPP